MKQLKYRFKSYSSKALLLALLSVLIIKNGFSQVNLQTGSATFSLPMFNWQDHKSRLNSVVALNYNSGNGLKVNEVASNVGQGWSLLAGGAITRLQVGEPDDQNARHGSSEQDLTKYPAGYLYATVPAYNGCPDALSKYPLYGSRNQLYTQHNVVAEDKQLDYFAFQFNGKAGMFVLNPKEGDVGVSLGDSKMKITFQRDQALVNQGIRTTITSFTIQDVDGMIYKFAKHGLTKVLQSNYCDAGMVEEQTQPKLESGKVYHQAGFDKGRLVNPWVIGSWYLTEVKDPLTQRTIKFTYDAIRNINHTAGEDISYNSNGNYSLITHKKSITQTPDITSIVYPDGHTVTFTYGADRVDLTGAKALSAIDIAYQGRAVSQYQLNTTYFILNRYGTPVSSYQKKVARLCLKSVKKIGVDLKEDTPPYVFDYYLGSNNSDDFVPPPFFYAKDIWGFYNGSSSADINGSPVRLVPNPAFISSLTNDELIGLCFLKNGVSGAYLNPKSLYAKNGLLRQIVYPTGGTLSYDYEQNFGKITGVERMVGGVHVSQTSSTDGGHSNGCSNPITTKYHYVLDGAGRPSSLWGLEMPVNSMTMNSYYKPESQRYRWTLKSGIFGECYYKFMYPGILSQQQAVSLTDFQKFMEAAAPVLGIISIATTVMDVVTLCLGPTPLAIVAVVVDVIGGIVTLILSCTQDHTKNTTTTIYYNSDLNGASPLPTQFKRVEVVENPATIGKTVHEFTSDEDYTIWEPTNPAFSSKQRFAPWAYGLPKLITVWDSAGKKVKQIQNEYDTTYAKRLIAETSFKYGTNPSGLYTDLVSCRCLVTKTSSQKSTDWNNPEIYNAQYNKEPNGNNGNMKVDFHGYYTGRVLLNKTYEREFKSSDPAQYVETVRGYYYNNYSNYEVSSIYTTQSNGDKNWVSYKYSCDYSEGIFDMFLQNNIVSLPVSTTTQVQKQGTGDPNSAEMSERTTTFLQLPNGDVKPAQILERRYDKPTVTWYAGTVLPPQTPVQSFTYDAAGNLIGLRDEGGRVISNLYDYNDKYITASVVHADPLLDKTAYTSFETENLGGWSLSGTFSRNSTSVPAVTGSRTFALLSQGANSLTANSLNAAKPYTLSFWSNNSNVTVYGGATLVKSAPATNGYTFYEYDIAQGNTSVMIKNNASVNANIDELRIYPKAARMRTVTYDPLIGKTSESDENNRITYYEYDNLGRQRFIKDENKHIVKMYEYNNVSKQNGCPVTYYSRLTSEVFTKSNCGSGYVGSEVTYTVPANKYTSTISQEDADAQVENELLANGQPYADANGTCLRLYYNTVQSKSDTTKSCGVGYKGAVVTYTVPANKYSSVISQADADQKALDDIAANALAYIDNPANAVCLINTDPEWSWESGKSYCQSVNGQLPAHQFIEEIDINPNSSSYGQTRWSDVGPTSACPAGTYFNASQSASFTRNDCPSGYAGSSVTYTVPPGKYTSTVSQAAADQQAINEINANGQAYANSNGTCEAVATCDYSNCSGEEYRCVNGSCEWGFRVYTGSYYDGWQWYCVYHYEWSDGSWSHDYYEPAPGENACLMPAY